jgi:hypothetical protein
MWRDGWWFRNRKVEDPCLRFLGLIYGLTGSGLHFFSQQIELAAPHVDDLVKLSSARFIVNKHSYSSFLPSSRAQDGTCNLLPD